MKDREVLEKLITTIPPGRESESRDNRISIAAWEIMLKIKVHGKA